MTTNANVDLNLFLNLPSGPKQRIVGAEAGRLAGSNATTGTRKVVPNGPIDFISRDNWVCRSGPRLSTHTGNVQFMIADDPIFALIERHRGLPARSLRRFQTKIRFKRRIGLGVMRQNG
jgi:hypothetical protein